MGRGSSGVGGGGRGGGATKNAPPTPTNTVQLPTPQQVASGNVLPKGGVAFSSFEKMTDDQKAQVINDALNTGVPLFLDDSGLQRFAYFTGMNNTPTVVSDAQLDKMKGEEMFRTVNDAYNSSKDIGYSSKDIAEQISSGDFTMYSDSGGSAHGKAIYFASDLTDSTLYGNSGKNPMTMRAKITGGKSISETALDNQYSKALRNNDPVAKACSKAGHGSDRNLFALAKGYDVITPSSNWNSYYMVLNRRCLSVSKTVKPTKIGHASGWKSM